jgi:hypothetical protein
MSNSNPLLLRKSPVSRSIGIAALSVAAALLISRRPSLHLQSAPMSLILCAMMISARFDGIGVGLRSNRSIIEWNGSRLRAADQSPCGASSYVPRAIIIEVGT